MNIIPGFVPFCNRFFLFCENLILKTRIDCFFCVYCHKKTSVFLGNIWQIPQNAPIPADAPRAGLSGGEKARSFPRLSFHTGNNDMLSPCRKNPLFPRKEGTSPSQKASQSLPPERQINSDHFLPGRVPGRKYSSDCKCGISRREIMRAAGCKKLSGRPARGFPTVKMMPSFFGKRASF